MLETSDKQGVEMERELGLPHGLIRKWQKRIQVNTATDALELSEVEQLKAQLRAVERELDILKKTVGIVSKEARP